MTVYNVIYVRTDSGNFVNEIQVLGSFLSHGDVRRCFNDAKTQIVVNDPKYWIAKKNNCIKSIENLWLCFWVDDGDNYYEVNLRIIQSTIEN